MIRIQIEATSATVLLAICLAVALVCHFREEVVYHAVFALLYVAFCINQYLPNILDLDFGSISISIVMDQQAVHTLAVIKNPDTPIDSKLGLLEKLKALIKHQNIPEAAVSATFEVFRYAIYTSQLTKLGFEGLSVLVRRLTNQGLLMAIATHATQFYPLLTGILGDLDDTRRIWAIKAFMEFWICQPLEVSEVMQGILSGGNPPMKMSALLWVVKMAESSRRRNFRFDPTTFVPSIINCLEDDHDNVRDMAKASLITLFRIDPSLYHQYRGHLETYGGKQISDEIRSQLNNQSVGLEVGMASTQDVLINRDHGALEEATKPEPHQSISEPAFPIASKLPAEAVHNPSSSIGSKPATLVVTTPAAPIETHSTVSTVSNLSAFVTTKPSTAPISVPSESVSGPSSSVMSKPTISKPLMSRIPRRSGSLSSKSGNSAPPTPTDSTFEPKTDEEVQPKAAKQVERKTVNQVPPKASRPVEHKVIKHIEPKVAKAVQHKAVKPVEPKVIKPVEADVVSQIESKTIKAAQPRAVKPDELKAAKAIEPRVIKQGKPKTLEELIAEYGPEAYEELDAAAKKKLEDTLPMDIDSKRDLEDFFREIRPHFEGKETEDNWTLRERAIIKMKRLAMGNAPHRYRDTFIGGVRGLLDGILKAAISLRTSTSLAACHLIQEVAKVAGANLENGVEIILQTMVKACGNTKSIAAGNANVTVITIFEHVPYNARLLYHISAAVHDKIVRPRIYATVWLKTIIDRHAPHKGVIEHGEGLATIMKCIRDGLNDSSKDVRDSMRPTYWSFWLVWPGKADSIMSELPLPKQKQLTSDPSNPNKEAMVLPPHPTKSDMKPTSSHAGPSTKSKLTLKETIAMQKKEKLAANMERPGSALSSSTPSRPNIPRPMTSMGMSAKASSSASTSTPFQTGTLSSAPIRPLRVTRKVDLGRSNTTDHIPIRRPVKEDTTSEHPIDANPGKGKRKVSPPPPKPSPPPSSIPSKYKTGYKPGNGQPMSSVARGKRVVQDDRSSNENTPPSQILSFPIKGKTIAQATNSMDVVITSKRHAPRSEGHRSAGSDASSTGGVVPSNHISNSPTKAAEDFTMVFPSVKSLNLRGILPENAGKEKVTFESARALADSTEFNTTSRIGVLSPAINTKIVSDDYLSSQDEENSNSTPLGAHITQISQNPGELYGKKENSPSKARIPKVHPDGKVAMDVYEDPEQLTTEKSDGPSVTRPTVLEELAVPVNNSPLRPAAIKGTWEQMILESAIHRAEARSLDYFTLRKVHKLIRENADMSWGADNTQFDRFVQVLLAILEEPINNVTKADSTIDMRYQILLTIRTMLRQRQDLFSIYFPRALCAIVRARQFYSAKDHFIVGMDTCIANIIAATTREEECIDAILDTIETTDTEGQGIRSVITGLLVLADLLEKLSNINRILDSESTKKRLNDVAVARLRDTNGTEVRLSSVKLCMELKTHFGDEEFWATMNPAGSDARNLLAYYLAKRETLDGDLLIARHS